ncbi:hypothetical protein Pint_02173 [Pistacia integerrima]|uniref:Uncharacterized protein n=1 Tax=Pistacia integerrima TaxID=434235 RepID=A0ACC0ZHI6_9ROSI|nr:hypothetical protein Pint_02173 [Pistacia integerrima]
MNDLISSSFKHRVPLDLEAGGQAGKETTNLDKFFEDVENVKDDMKIVEKLYKRLQGIK